MSPFKGLSAFPVTPADPDGRVDVDALRGLVARLVEAKVDSIGLLGSTGTYVYLSRAERRRAVEAAVAEARGRVPLLVGAGALRTDDAVALARDAAEAGADALLLAPVSYTPLTDEEVFVHFQAVAAATDRPLCVYNNPGTTHFTFGDDLIARLSQVDRVAAVKNPAPPQPEAAGAVAALRARVADGFSLGHSGDWRAPETLLVGGEAWYSVAAGLWPRTCLEIARAAQAGEAERTRVLTARLEPMWALFRQYGGLRVVHFAAARLGLHRAEPPRPILPPPPEAQARIVEVMDELGLA